jgi:hypothetical protein
LVQFVFFTKIQFYNLYYSYAPRVEMMIGFSMRMQIHLQVLRSLNQF